MSVPTRGGSDPVDPERLRTDRYVPVLSSVDRRGAVVEGWFCTSSGVTGPGQYRGLAVKTPRGL